MNTRKKITFLIVLQYVLFCFGLSVAAAGFVLFYRDIYADDPYWTRILTVTAAAFLVAAVIVNTIRHRLSQKMKSRQQALSAWQLR
jgi:hypothetical protein